MKTSQDYTDNPNIRDGAVNQNHAEAMATVGDDLKSLKQNGVILARHLKEDAQELSKSAVKEASHQMSDMKVRADRYMKAMERSVVENPMQSIGVAFAAGAVLSLLMGRR